MDFQRRETLELRDSHGQQVNRENKSRNEVPRNVIGNLTCEIWQICLKRTTHREKNDEAKQKLAIDQSEMESDAKERNTYDLCWIQTVNPNKSDSCGNNRYEYFPLIRQKWGTTELNGKRTQLPSDREHVGDDNDKQKGRKSKRRWTERRGEMAMWRKWMTAKKQTAENTIRKIFDVANYSGTRSHFKKNEEH